MEKAIFIPDFNKEFLNKLASLSLTSVFLNETNLNDSSISKIQESLPSVAINVCLNIFSGKDLLDKFPDCNPVEASGRDCSYLWYQGVCPNNEKVRKLRLVEVQKALDLNGLSGVWLDSLHFPTFWQKNDPEIFDSCYCKNCMEKFKKYIGGDTLPEKLEDLVDAIDGQYYLEWLQFKSDTISSFVESVKELVQKSGKNIKLGIFVVPWKDKEYGSAVTRILGTDFSTLGDLVDYLTPMLFSQTLGRDSSWVKESVEYFEVFGTKILPAIFSTKEASQISDLDFESILDRALSKPSVGAVITDITDIVNNPSKFSILRSKFSAT